MWRSTAARRRASLLRLVIAAGLLPAAASAQTYVVTDVESMNDLLIDDIVTCPRADGVYVSGSYEGCPTGRAPAVGECGLDFVCPETITVPDAVAAADHYWTHVIAWPLVLDMTVATDSVFVFNAADHGPFPEESVEWTVWGADAPGVAAFPAGWSPGRLCAIFRQGWVESGNCPGDDSDDYTGLYRFDRPYRYVAVYANYSITIFLDRAHTTWPVEGDDGAEPGWQSSDAELDAVSRPLGPAPIIDLGPDVTTCGPGEVTVTARLLFGLVHRYLWDTDGDGIPDGSGPSIDVTYDTPGIYTVSVRAIGECGCAEDAVTIEVRECPLAVTFADLRARRGATGEVVIEWETAEEDGTLAFVVERGSGRDGTFTRIGAPLAATGASSRYRQVDREIGVAHSWYRVREIAERGAGDVSPPFAAEGDPGTASRGARRRGAGR